jgi:hypothetical protein
MNPLFIPKDLARKTKEGEEKFCVVSLDGVDIRAIECYDENGKLYRVNVWGIKGTEQDTKDGSVAYDIGIDNETMKRLRKQTESIYPCAKINFFEANR